MADQVASIGGWVCIVIGAVFSVIGGIGLLRLPDFFSRMHAGSITDTMGAMLIFAGLALQSGFSLITLKLLMIVIFMLISGTTAAHALAGAALAAGERPLEGDEPGKLSRR